MMRLCEGKLTENMKKVVYTHDATIVYDAGALDDRICPLCEASFEIRKLDNECIELAKEAEAFRLELEQLKKEKAFHV